MIRHPLGEQGGHLAEVLRFGEVVVGAGKDHEDILAGEFLGQAPALVERSKSGIYFSGWLPEVTAAWFSGSRSGRDGENLRRR